MSIKENTKIFNLKNLMVLISFVEMVTGILSESYLYTAVGIFGIMYFFDFSFSKRYKNKAISVVTKILFALLILCVGVISFFEALMTIDYKGLEPQLWIFPVIAVMFILRLALKISLGEKENGNKIFPPVMIIFYIITAILVLLANIYAGEGNFASDIINFFGQFFIEPAAAAVLSAAELLLLIINIKK